MNCVDKKNVFRYLSNILVQKVVRLNRIKIRIMYKMLKVYLVVQFVFLIQIGMGQKTITPIERYGRLQVDGAKLTSTITNEPVQLRGMSMFWSQWGGNYYTADVISKLVFDWKINVIRIAVAPSEGVASNSKVNTVIDAAIAEGIYVVIDWHSHEAELEEQKSKEFFAAMATKYGSNPNVIYELYNEPIEQGWISDIKPYCEAVIDTIRSIDTNNLIICGTSSWSQDVDDVIGNEIIDVNVAYTLHYYAATHDASLRQKALSAINSNIPLFVTEFGTTEANGDGYIDKLESNIWWDFLEEHSISWCNWSVFDKDEASAALKPGTSTNGDWTIEDYTISGLFVRDKLRSMYELPIFDNDLSLKSNFDKPLIHVDTEFEFGFELFNGVEIVEDSLVKYSFEISNGGAVSDSGVFISNKVPGEYVLFVTACYDTLVTTGSYKFTVTDIKTGELTNEDELTMLALSSGGVYKHSTNMNVLSSLLKAIPNEGTSLSNYTWEVVTDTSGYLAKSNSTVKSVFGIYVISPVEQSAKINYDMKGSVNDLMNGKAITDAPFTLNLGENLFIVEYTGQADESFFAFEFTDINGIPLDFITYSISSTNSYDCAGDWAGKAYVSSKCSLCIGGSTGVLGCPGPYNGSPALIPGVIENEEYDFGGSGVAYYDDSNGNEAGIDIRNPDNVDLQYTSDTKFGSGDVGVGWISNNEWLKYTVNVTTTQRYLIDFRVASPNSTGEFDLEIDGKSILPSTFKVASTGGWGTWESQRSDTIILKSGVKELFFKVVKGGFNITNMQFHIYNAVGLESLKKSKSNIYPNPFTDSFIINADQPLNYNILNMQGELIENGECKSECEIGSDIISGMYLLELFEGDNKVVSKLIKQ